LYNNKNVMTSTRVKEKLTPFKMCARQTKQTAQSLFKIGIKKKEKSKRFFKLVSLETNRNN